MGWSRILLEALAGLIVPFSVAPVSIGLYIATEKIIRGTHLWIDVFFRGGILEQVGERTPSPLSASVFL